MARINYIEKTDAPAEVKAIYDEIEKKFAMPEVVNAVKIFAHTPELMPHVLGFAGQILNGPGRLGTRIREVISLRVSHY
jgi:hypothetical protein